MTHAEMRIAIAEALGIKPEVIAAWVDWSKADKQHQLGEISDDEYYRRHLRKQLATEIQNYPADLNAMFDAEASLKLTELWDMQHHLRIIVDAKYPLSHSTAEQRAESFLRVKGLWK